MTSLAVSTDSFNREIHWSDRLQMMSATGINAYKLRTNNLITIHIRLMCVKYGIEQLGYEGYVELKFISSVDSKRGTILPGITNLL